MYVGKNSDRPWCAEMSGRGSRWSVMQHGYYGDLGDDGFGEGARMIELQIMCV